MEYTDKEIESIKAEAHDKGWRKGIIVISIIWSIVLIFALIVTH